MKTNTIHTIVRSNSASQELEFDQSFLPWTEALPANLRRLLDEELSAGNRIRFAAGCGLEPETAVLLLLEHTFINIPRILPSGVTMRQRPPGSEWVYEYTSGDGVFILACSSDPIDVNTVEHAAFRAIPASTCVGF